MLLRDSARLAPQPRCKRIGGEGHSETGREGHVQNRRHRESDGEVGHPAPAAEERRRHHEQACAGRHEPHDRHRHRVPRERRCQRHCPTVARFPQRGLTPLWKSGRNYCDQQGEARKNCDGSGLWGRGEPGRFGRCGVAGGEPLQHGVHAILFGQQELPEGRDRSAACLPTHSDRRCSSTRRWPRRARLVRANASRSPSVRPGGATMPRQFDRSRSTPSSRRVGASSPGTRVTTTRRVSGGCPRRSVRRTRRSRSRRRSPVRRAAPPTPHRRRERRCS